MSIKCRIYCALNKVNIDANQKRNAILDKVDTIDYMIKPDLAKRIVHIAIPFLNLHQPTQIITNSLHAGINICIISNDMIAHLKSGKYKLVFHSVFNLSLTVATLAAAILAPNLLLTLSEGTVLAEKLCGVAKALYRKDTKQARNELFWAARSVVVLTASLRPEIMIISLLMQSAFELYNAYGEYKNDRWLEAGANIVLATIRINQAKNMMGVVYDQYQKRKAKYELEQKIKKVYEDHERRLKEAVFNHDKDQFAVKSPTKEGMHSLTDDFYFIGLSRGHAYRGEGGDPFVVSRGSGVKIHDLEKKAYLFYEYLPSGYPRINIFQHPPEQYINYVATNNGFSLCGLPDGSCSGNFPVWKNWYSLEDKSRSNVNYDPQNEIIGRCTHPELGEGKWLFKIIPQESGQSFLLSVIFGNNGTDEWFQASRDAVMDKTIVLPTS